jgi:cell division transport system permease protein
MRKLFERPDIAFSADDTHAFLPWLIGTMAALTTFLLCLGMTLNHWVAGREDSYSHVFNVIIPAEVAAQKDTVYKVQGALKKTPGVDSVAEVRSDKLKSMLKPWLGSGDTFDALPVPTVFDVTLATPARGIDYEELQRQLAAIAPGTEVDSYEQWAGSFKQFSTAIKYMSFLLALMITGAMVVMIAFTSRASLKLHARTVGLLHAVGAEDGYIAGQFQQEAFRLTLPGAFFGCIAAGIAYWALGVYVGSLEIAILPSLYMTPAHAVVLVLMPILCSATAWGVAKFTISSQLRQVL